MGFKIMFWMSLKWKWLAVGNEWIFVAVCSLQCLARPRGRAAPWFHCWGRLEERHGSPLFLSEKWVPGSSELDQCVGSCPLWGWLAECRAAVCITSTYSSFQGCSVWVWHGSVGITGTDWRASAVVSWLGRCQQDKRGCLMGASGPLLVISTKWGSKFSNSP